MKTTKVVLQTHTIKRTSLIENLKKHWQLFLFLILPLLYIIIFAYGPMMGLQIAFKDFDAAKGVWKSMGWIEAFQKFYQLIPVRTCTEKHIGYIGVLACGTFSCTNTLGIEY